MYKLAYLKVIADPTDAMRLISMFCHIYPTLRTVSAMSVVHLATRTKQEQSQYKTSLAPAQLLSYQELQEQLKRVGDKAPGTLSYKLDGRRKIMSVTLKPQTQDRYLVVTQTLLDKHAKKYPGYTIEVCCHTRPSHRAMEPIVNWTQHHKHLVHTVHWQKEEAKQIIIPATLLWEFLQRA